MACKRSPVRSRYSPPSAQMRVTNTVDFKSKSTVFLYLSASKFIAVLQILRKIKVEVHMNLISTINFYPADKLADDHLFCFKAGTIVQVCVRDQFFVQLRSRPAEDTVPVQFSAPTRCSLPCESSFPFSPISPLRAACIKAATKNPKKAPASKNAIPIKKFRMAHLTPCRCRAASGRLPSG
jgi:hypothetical protein